MIVRCKQLLALILFFFSQSLQAQHHFDPEDFDKIVASEQHAARPVISFKESSLTDGYDLLHMNAYWKMDPRIRAVEGHITYDFRAGSTSLQSIYFDLSDTLVLDSVYYHESRLESYERPGGDLLKLNLPSDITAGTIDSITIFYHGTPITTGFGSFTQSSHDNDSILWTLSEPYGAKDWFPCKNSLADKMDSVDIRIEIPNRYLAGSNGILAAIDPVNDSTKVMHWKSHYPIATCLVGISITNYVSFETTCVLESGDSFPVVEYVYPEDSAYYATHPGTVIPIIQLYSSLFGDYPFKDEKYGHAQWNWGGGEEHQTMSFVTFPDIFELIAHELGHQWFGDKITCGSWQDIWLNEGFATYLAGLSYENLAPVYWNLYKFGRMYGALSDSTGSVFCEDTTNVSRIFSGPLTYSKGMYLLHMLRWKLGDDAFFTAVYDYINDTSLCYGFAKTEDLKQHLESVSGQSLDEFFNDWFYGKGAPTYHIQWGTATDRTVAISIHQTQNNPSVSFFEMPLPIELKDAIHDTTIVLQNDFNDLTYRTAPLSFVPDSLFFDPDLWILAKHEVQKNDLLSQPLLLYPNPATDYINISFHSNEELVEEINLYDVLGREMVSLPAGNTSFFDFVKVDISNLSGGLYFVEIRSNTNTYLQKIEKY